MASNNSGGLASLGTSGRHSRGYGTSLIGIRHIVLLIVVIVVILGIVQITRSVPSPKLQRSIGTTVSVAGSSPTLPWPSVGESIVGIQGIGVMGSSGGNQPVPIASIAKMMTALVILNDHPISLGQQGASITITPADVATEQSDQAQSQSVVAVTAGETLTELQALEALLVPSGNNIATVLADWDAGSVASFTLKMNQEAKILGMNNTHYADASGFSSSTVSTAADQLKLLMKAMANPVFAAIVAEPQVTLPVAGLQYNYDYVLGTNGFVGVKTGSDGPAGGCFAFAAVHKVAGRSFTVDGVVLGQQASTAQPSILRVALTAATQLANAAAQAVSYVTLLPNHQVVAKYLTPWNSPVSISTTAGISTLGWPGLQVPVTLALKTPTVGATSNLSAGTLLVALGSNTPATKIPLVLSSTIKSPSITWKLFR